VICFIQDDKLGGDVIKAYTISPGIYDTAVSRGPVLPIMS